MTKFIKFAFGHSTKCDGIMVVNSQLPKIFSRFLTQLIFMLGIPFFFLSFMLVYKPERISDFFDMGRGLLSFNLTILFCIILLIMVVSRLVQYFMRKTINLSLLLHTIWCAGEYVVSSFFAALYVFLMYRQDAPFFDVLGRCFPYLLSILIFPYVILTFMFLYLGVRESESSDAESGTVIRFLDNTKRLKLAVASSAVLYIMSEENYVRIYYLDGSLVREYVLRCSMKSLEETASKHGLVRCQRCFYVNPAHIRVLRRDKDGAIVAEIDIPGQKSIPVSKRYYDALSSIL